MKPQISCKRSDGGVAPIFSSKDELVEGRHGCPCQLRLQGPLAVGPKRQWVARMPVGPTDCDIRRHQALGGIGKKLWELSHSQNFVRAALAQNCSFQRRWRYALPTRLLFFGSKGGGDMPCQHAFFFFAFEAAASLLFGLVPRIILMLAGCRSSCFGF